MSSVARIVGYICVTIAVSVAVALTKDSLPLLFGIAALYVISTDKGK